MAHAKARIWPGLARLFPLRSAADLRGGDELSYSEVDTLGSLYDFVNFGAKRDGVVRERVIQTLSQTMESHQFGAPGIVFAPKLTNVYSRVTLIWHTLNIARTLMSHGGQGPKGQHR